MGSSTPEEAIRRTMAQYGHLCDDGRFDEFAGLFSEDARFHVMGRTQEGRDAIKAFMEVGQREELRGRHVILPSVIDLAEDEQAASAWTDFFFLNKAKEITTLGRYHDQLRLDADGRWRFAVREIVFLGDQPEITQPPLG